ncbi:uncharacterized protein LOC112903425 isoform X2 [Panicum hallii]|uniref:uncharacterized protein LOC112903425 isoform X2 n=1 Tax=Panicum hallii TaxID=206008 RepID=UPI000DF4D9BA|nr:uncharacterized protein LOC112903425 isoform X2 [Panicum hallii]
MVRPATAAELRLASTRAARPCQAQNSFHLFRPLYSRAQRPLLFLLASQQPAAQAPAAGGASARLNMLLDLLHFLQRAPGCWIDCEKGREIESAMDLVVQSVCCCLLFVLTMGGLSRRFLNLVMDNRIRGVRSLRCIDLTRHHLFNTTIPAQSPNGKGSGSGLQDAPTSRETAAVADNRGNKQVAGDTLKMEEIRLPSPSFSICSSATSKGWDIECIPLAGHKVFCTDRSGWTIIFDANMRQVDIMPILQRPKRRPISIFIPSDAAADNHDDVEGSLFVLESAPNDEVRYSGQLSSQFEAFVCRKPTMTASTNPCHHLLLPPPPFVRDPKYSRSWPPKISSYAVVNGGSGSSTQIRISAEGAGTYSLDTVLHTWSQLGECALPFRGKVEYVPELKLWFGISRKDRTLVAADLSAMGSQTLLVTVGMEFDPPEQWLAARHPQLVNLGFGRFCIVRFFYTRTSLAFGEVYEEYFVVLTGVEVVRRDNDVSGNGSKGKVELQMIKHKSWYHMCFGSDGTIESAF